ncbi:C4-dicarboxylate TRAP transporter substrate-binding protein [Bacillus sp. JJ1533]|uniref:C4-dicarboxylate TRAP transporter substrate-binding protein n=1 Tax=Bacillus sp. JJ1533 TaxID=3122959 RepID=UPI002FFDAA89
MNIKFIRKGFVILLSIMLGLLAACSSPGSNSSSDGKEVIKLRIGSGHTVEGATWIRTIDNYFIPEVDKALESTNYKIEWTKAFGGTVAKLGEEIEAIGEGLLDIGFIVSPFEPSKLPITNIGYNTPFSSPDPGVIAEVAYDLVEKYPEFEKEYEKENQKLLGLGFTESYEIITDFPFETVEDLTGKKIGGAGANLEWIKPVGAVPVQGGLTETYQNIQTGVYNGYIMYTGSTIGYRLYEVAKYFTQVGFGSVIVGGLSVNADTFEGLPKEVQDVLVDVGKKYSFNMAEELSKETSKNLDQIESEGGVVTTLSDAEKLKWLEVLPNIPNDYAKRMNDEGLPGSDIMKDYIQGQMDHGHNFPKPYTID